MLPPFREATGSVHKVWNAFQNAVEDDYAKSRGSFPLTRDKTPTASQLLRYNRSRENIFVGFKYYVSRLSKEDWNTDHLSIYGKLTDSQIYKYRRNVEQGGMIHLLFILALKNLVKSKKVRLWMSLSIDVCYV